jgi:hypothetical protein
VLKVALNTIVPFVYILYYMPFMSLCLQDNAYIFYDKPFMSLCLQDKEYILYGKPVISLNLQDQAWCNKTCLPIRIICPALQLNKIAIPLCWNSYTIR